MLDSPLAIVRDIADKAKLKLYPNEEGFFAVLWSQTGTPVMRVMIRILAKTFRETDGRLDSNFSPTFAFALASWIRSHPADKGESYLHHATRLVGKLERRLEASDIDDPEDDPWQQLTNKVSDSFAEFGDILDFPKLRVARR